jgi:CheY-like chemotaxis protein
VKTVLYVDDDLDDITFFKKAMRNLDPSVDVISFLDSGEGIKYLSSSSIIPSIIFLDSNMPTMNGLECVIAIKRDPRLRRIPVVLFSVGLSKEQIIQYNSLGIYQFISKSTIGELEKSLKHIILDLIKDH